MKDCTDCKHAKWARTAGGKLHPSGDGKCQYQWKAPQLPAAFYFIGREPVPLGGFINRRKPLKEHCVYFARKEN
jgi:hypothetical protein